jgi:hypothetical protein
MKPALPLKQTGQALAFPQPGQAGVAFPVLDGHGRG